MGGAAVEGDYCRALRRLRGIKGSPSSSPQDIADGLNWLSRGEITGYDLLPYGSNYTFLVAVHYEGADRLAVYKPRRGEAPLWDFPEGTLYRREVAAYLLCEALGWSFIPPTIVRDGPLGVGSLQLYVDADEEAHYFTFGKERVAEMQQVALFDCIANNADRKAGHCLLAKDGRVWAIDHGLTFHVAPKLRTVIWDFSGQSIPQPLLSNLADLQSALSPASELTRRMVRLLSVAEMAVLRRRIASIHERGVFPHPASARSIPWPPV